MNPFIKTEHLCYCYEEEDECGVAVLNDLSMEIAEGEFIAVLGHNGSGKSTLAKLLNMILTPTSGKIFVMGKDITDEEMSEEEMLELLSSDGMLVKRPLVIGGDFVLIGFKEAQWAEKLL